MKVQTKLNKVQSSQVQSLIDYTGLDLNTIVRVALHEYCQRHSVAIFQTSNVNIMQSTRLDIPAKPLESLDNSPPIDNNTIPHKVKLLWPEWSQLNPGKSNDEFMQYFIQDATE